MPRKQKRPKDGVYQRADSPYWWASYPDGNGKSTRRSTGVQVEADPKGLKALAVRATWMSEKHIEATGERATFDDLMFIYLRDESSQKRDPERDKCSARALFKVFQGRCLDGIGSADARGYIAARRDVGIAPSTINKELSLFSSALDWARNDLDWNIDNPFKGRHQTEPPGRDRWLTQEEAERLLDEAEKRRKRAPWLADFVRLGLNAGFRPGEMLWMEWERVDLKADRVSFEATVGREKTGQKNGKRGNVPLNQGAREAMLSRARFRATHCPDSPWVFCRHNGKRVTNVIKGWKAITTAAGLKDVHQHDLRRTFGSWLVQAGVGIERVSALLRHSSVSITARVYAHLRPSDLADAASVLDPKGLHSHAGNHARSLAHNSGAG